MEPVTAMANDSKMQADDILDKLLSKHKSEEMYELRRLQHQQRPVTDFNNKQLLEEFFCKRLPPPSLEAAAAVTDESGISNRAKQLELTASQSQDFMPEGVRLEVRGLFNQRRVTETLEGPLREEIDRTLQQGIERRQRRGRSRHSRANGNRHRTADSAGRQARQGRRHVRFNPPENGQYPMPQRDQSQIVDNLMQSPALNSLNPEAREEVVSEVRTLVQQQLVTSALSGEFRGVLELNIQQHLNRSQGGLTGEAFVRSLQRGRGRSATRNSDSGAARPSSSMGDGDLHREMRDMKSQLDELKKLVKTSFELQLDIQRSICQEVAAALSAFLTIHSSDSAAAILPTLPNPSGRASVVQTMPSSVPVVECGNCVICSDGAIDSMVYRCGHMCMCMACGMDLKSKGMKCPVCRAPITDVIRAYSSML